MTMQTQNMSTRTKLVFDALIANAEGDASASGFRDVYLDNAKPNDMKPAAFAGHLSKLAAMNLYHEVDGFAWGSIQTR